GFCDVASAGSVAGVCSRAFRCSLNGSLRVSCTYHARPQRKLLVPTTQLRSFRSPRTVTEAKVKVFKGATDSDGSEVRIERRYIGVESVEDLSDPIKLSIYPPAPAMAFWPEGFLAADNGAIHDVYTKQFLLKHLSAGGPRLREQPAVRELVEVLADQ